MAEPAEKATEAVGRRERAAFHAAASLAAALSAPVPVLTLLPAPVRAQTAPGAFVRQLGPYRFEVPPGCVFRSYRAGPDEPGGAFAFMGLLPELEPRTKADEKACEAMGWGDIIAVWVRWRSPQDGGARLHAMLEERINRSRWFPPVRESGFTRCRIEGGGHFELYASDTDSDVFFTCTGGHSPGCIRTEELAPELIADSIYPHKHRLQTPEISARTRRLLLDHIRVTSGG